MNIVFLVFLGVLVSRLVLFLGYSNLKYFKMTKSSKSFISFFYNKSLRDNVKFILVDLYSIIFLYYIFINFEYNSFWNLVLLSLMFFVLTVTMVTDLLEGYILNIYTYSGILIVGIINFIDVERFLSIWNYLGGFVIVILIFGIVLFIMPGKMGLGDVKLFLLVGIYFGFLDLIVVMFVSTLLGLIYGVYKVYIKKDEGSFVFGPFISYGCLIVLLFDISLPLM